MTAEIIAQIIGFMAFGLGVGAFLQKDDTRLKILFTAQAATLGVHFILLGAYTGAASVFITATRNFLSLFGWAKKIAPVFYIAVLGFGWYTYDAPVDIFPVLAGMIGTTALFYMHGVKMRLAFVLASGLWLIHNIMIGSIGPSLMETMMMGASLYRAWRLHVEHKQAIGNDTSLSL